MKHRILSLILPLMMLAAMLLTACGQESEPAVTEPPTEPPTQLHTVAPTQSQSAAEWASIDAAMTLEDADNLYAKGSDFLCFALITDGEKAEIRFKLADNIAAMMRGQDPNNQYYITMNEKRVGDVVLSENCDELILSGDYSYNQLCILANRIRGLEW